MAVKNLDTNGFLAVSDALATLQTLEVLSADSVKVRGRGVATIVMGSVGGSAVGIDQLVLEGRVVEGVGTWVQFLAAWGGANENNVLLNDPEDISNTAHGAGNERAAQVDFSGWAEVRALTAQASVTALAVTRTLQFLFAENAKK